MRGYAAQLCVQEVEDARGALEVDRAVPHRGPGGARG